MAGLTWQMDEMGAWRPRLPLDRPKPPNYEFNAKNRAGTALTALYTASDKSWVVKAS